MAGALHRGSGPFPVALEVLEITGDGIAVPHLRAGQASGAATDVLLSLSGDAVLHDCVVETNTKSAVAAFVIRQFFTAV